MSFFKLAVKSLIRNHGRLEELGTRTLLGAPGLTTRSKKLLGAKGVATRNKDATWSPQVVQIGALVTVVILFTFMHVHAVQGVWCTQCTYELFIEEQLS